MIQISEEQLAKWCHQERGIEAQEFLYGRLPSPLINLSMVRHVAMGHIVCYRTLFDREWMREGMIYIRYYDVWETDADLATLAFAAIGHDPPWDRPLTLEYGKDEWHLAKAIGLMASIFGWEVLYFPSLVPAVVSIDDEGGLMMWITDQNAPREFADQLTADFAAFVAAKRADYK